MARNFSGLGHVDRGAIEFVCGVDKGQVAKTTMQLVILERGEDNPALAFLAGTAGTAKTMNICVAFAGKSDLDDVGDIGEVHSSSGDVTREEHASLCRAEVFCSTSALLLGELGVDFVGAQTSEGTSSLGGEFVEDGGSKPDLCGTVEVDNGLEGAALARKARRKGALHQFVQSGRDVLEAVSIDILLGNALVGGLFIFVYTLGKVETGPHGLADEVDNVAGNGGGEHDILAFNFTGVGQMPFDLINLHGKAFVKQTVGLIQDQGVEVGGLDTRIGIGEDVLETAGRADQQVTALTLRLLEHAALLGAANGRLYNNACVGRDLLGLDSDLLGQFARGRDDNGTDVAGLGPLVAAAPFSERGVVLDDALDNGDEEAKGFSGARLSLGDAVRRS